MLTTRLFYYAVGNLDTFTATWETIYATDGNL